MSGSTLSRTLRRLALSIGITYSITPGALAITYPAKFNADSLAPICAAFIRMTRSIGDETLKQSMISAR